MSRALRLLVALFVLLASFPLLAGASSQGASQADAARAEHQRIVDFWTVERVAQAVPRDFAFDPSTGRFHPSHHRPDHAGGPGGGGGGDNGDSTTVTGASWEGGGTVVNSTGKVLFSLGTTYYVCSASVVNDSASGRSLVLTAAHCVYDNEGAGEFAENWMFIPNYDAQPAPLTTSGSFCAQTIYGCWTATALVVHNGFASAGGFNATAIVHDFAFAVLGLGGKNGTLVESLGTQNIVFTNVSRGTRVHAFGYPHAAPYNGTDLVYCAGDAGFDNRLAQLTYKLRCNMTGGSSGGPWYYQFSGSNGTGTAVSVNSYRYLGGSDMYGPKFNSNTAALYNAAHTTTGDAIVP